MKIFSVVLIALCISAFGQSPILVHPQPQKVVVYLSGAEIGFKEALPLKKGENIIQFKGLAPSLVSESVQVSADVELIAVSTRLEHLSPLEVNPELNQIRDSITVLKDQITSINNQIDAYQAERQTLLQNQQITNTSSSSLLPELTKLADFFRERILKINTAMTALNKKMQLINSRLVIATGAFMDEKSKTDTSRYTLEVIVNAKETRTVDFAVRYLAAAAEWQASYDIIAAEINKPVTLRYKAQVYNRTGLDWKDVALSLSTGDISVSANRPFLTAWILNYSSAANEGFINALAQNISQDRQEDTAEIEEREASELNTTFNLEQNRSVKSDGRPSNISLTSETLHASFEYVTVPKVELSAFLIAKITGWEKLNLIDGVANIYYKNTYIGESFINTRMIGDTLELSLGRDNQIVISRAKVEDKGATPLLGTKRNESFIYEIQGRNNKSIPIVIKTQDQVPVSQENDITVEVTDISGASLDAASGRIQWVRTLSPGDILKYRVAFSVKYPKNKTVHIRKSRTIRTPRFRH
jgi:uncharacterized protein (TIGR02231 family)